MDNTNIISAIFDVTSCLYDEMSDRLPDKGHRILFTKLTALGKQLVDAERASFWKWDKKSHIIWTTAASETDTIVIPDSTGLVGKALREGRMIITNDPYNDPDFNPDIDKKTGFVTRSVMVMPISDSKGEYIGAYQVINKNGDAKFDEKEDRRRLSLAAVICGLALESDFFLEGSNTDTLTGLRTRSGFFVDLNWRYAAAIKDPDRSVSILMCDIDDLGKINDSCSPQAGDEAVKKLGSVFGSYSSDKCGVYRWGSDEFVMIMIDTDITAMRDTAEEIRRSISGSSFESSGKSMSFTVSIGASECSSHLDIAENIRIVEKNVSTAKQAGKDTVICT